MLPPMLAKLVITKVFHIREQSFNNTHCLSEIKTESIAVMSGMHGPGGNPATFI